MAEDDLLRPADLESALREHYAKDSTSVEFQSLSAGDIASAARANRSRTRWILLAAACLAVIGAGVVVVPRVLADRPVPASPAPVTPIPTTSAPTSAAPTPSAIPSPSPTGEWFTWSRRADAPIDPTEYQTVTAGGYDYYIYSAGGEDGCRRLRGYRHDPIADVWQQLPDAVVPRLWCMTSGVFAHGDDIYVLVDAYGDQDVNPEGMQRLLVYRAAQGAWETLPSLEYGERCESFGTDDGIYCSVRSLQPLRYAFFDFATGSWRESSIETGVAGEASMIDPVPVAGRTRILLTVWPVDWSVGGTVTLLTLDPGTGELSRTSHEMSMEELQRLSGGDWQWVSPGFLYGGPMEIWGAGTEGWLVDLRSGRWSTIEIPDAVDDPDVDYLNHIQGAGWAKQAYGDQVASSLAIRDFLYDPLAGRWLRFPAPSAPPPDVDRPESAEGMVWVGSGPATKCEWSTPAQCWELVVEPIDRVALEVSSEEIAAGNRAVR